MKKNKTTYFTSSLAGLVGIAFLAGSPLLIGQNEEATGVPDTENQATSSEILQEEDELDAETQTTITTGTEPTPQEVITVYEETTSTKPADWKGKFNVLVVNAPEGKSNFDKLYEQQKTEIEIGEGKLEAYDLLVVELMPENENSVINRRDIEWATADRLRQHYFPEEPNVFQVLLATKDGSVILRETSPVDLDVIYAGLDEFYGKPETTLEGATEPEAAPTPATKRGEAASTTGATDAPAVGTPTQTDAD